MGNNFRLRHIGWQIVSIGVKAATAAASLDRPRHGAVIVTPHGNAYKACHGSVYGPQSLLCFVWAIVGDVHQQMLHYHMYIQY
jgi:hypothetical protein